MTILSVFSAAQLVAIHNATGPAKPAKKFENAAVGVTRTLRAIQTAGMTELQAVEAAGLAHKLAPAAPSAPILLPPVVANLATGEVMDRPRQLHAPLRLVEGSPVANARRVAAAAVEQLRATHQAAAPAPAPAPVKARQSGAAPARTNATIGQVLDALRAPGGATLAQLTVAAGWSAPFERRNLSILQRKHGVVVEHDGAPGEARRFWTKR